MKNQSSESTIWQQAIAQVCGVVRDKQQQIRWMFAAFLSGGHVLLEDTPGMGKTTLARTMAATLGLDSRRIQFTSDLMPADVVGMGLPIMHEGHTKMVFHPGPMFANILLADEINRASPRTQSALLEAMAEGAATVDGVRHTLPNPFWVIATQNPVDLSGTFPLPDSQMDRFALRISLGYPGPDEEIRMLLSGGAVDLRHLEPVLTLDQVLLARKQVLSVQVSETIAEYIQALGQATRQSPEVSSGLSPRALLSLLATSKALAWLDGRDYVVPQDIQEVFVASSAHRLVMPGAAWSQRQDLAYSLLSEASLQMPKGK